MSSRCGRRPALVAGAMGLAEYRVAFQSQGMTAEKWIGPTVESQIDELAQAGGEERPVDSRGICLRPRRNSLRHRCPLPRLWKARGVAVRRSESLNDSPEFAAALASLVTARIKQVSGVECQVPGAGPADA